MTLDVSVDGAADVITGRCDEIRNERERFPDELKVLVVRSDSMVCLEAVAAAEAMVHVVILVVWSLMDEFGL